MSQFPPLYTAIEILLIDSWGLGAQGAILLDPTHTGGVAPRLLANTAGITMCGARCRFPRVIPRPKAFCDLGRAGSYSWGCVLI